MRRRKSAKELSSVIGESRRTGRSLLCNRTREIKQPVSHSHSRLRIEISAESAAPWAWETSRTKKTFQTPVTYVSIRRWSKGEAARCPARGGAFRLLNSPALFLENTMFHKCWSLWTKRQPERLRHGRLAQAYRPGVEVLEDRTLLSAGL